MALSATIYHVQIALSDVDRGVYESLDLRVARHPSESMRYMLTRLLAYGLEYVDGIAFSKGGLSSADEPPLAVHDRTGLLLAWIDVGAPSADRLHKASKAAPRVAVYSSADPALLRKEARSRAVHKLEAIELFRFEPAFLDELEGHVERNTKLEIVRTDGVLYVTAPGGTFEGKVEALSFVEPPG